MQNLEESVKEILERNKRVEADKAWEVSWTRKIFVLLLTYFCALAWLEFAGQRGAWLGAFVPALGYLLSTLTLPPLKAWWLRKRSK